ncbi:MAG: VanW family protein [bacterium]
MKLNWLKNKWSESVTNSEVPKKYHWLAPFLVAIFIFVVLIAIAIYFFELSYENRIYPGAKVGSIALGGLTKSEAVDQLFNTTENIERDGIKLIYRNGTTTAIKVTPAISGLTDPDLSRTIISFDNHNAIDRVFLYGRGQSWWNNLYQQVTMLIYGRQFGAEYGLDAEAMTEVLDAQFSDFKKEFKNAQPKIVWDGEAYRIEIIPAQDGITFDYQLVIEKIRYNLDQLRNLPIEVRDEYRLAEISYDEALANKKLIEDAIIYPAPIFTYEDKTFSINKQEWGQMLELVNRDGKIALSVNKDIWLPWANRVLASDINVKPLDAAAEMKDGKIISLSLQKNGLEVDMNATFDKLLFLLKADNSVDKKVEVATKVLLPKSEVADVNDLGIKEIIGVGQSDFSGSPVNRRKNIATGAAKLHGLLIKPGEEFGTIGNLGPIDAEGGYFTELVIKDNKTLPEFGGGLCQVGTTMFRAVLASGLPVTERSAHAYSVTYYLQDGLAGVDATLYEPHPDLSFVNDTGNYILIQTKIDGNNLIFTFWGTKDGRKAEQSKVRNWDYVSPPDTKYIETTDLAVGKKKCTETAHKGLKASFDYTVTYADGSQKKKTFYSAYKPWQAVCLIGVEKLATTTAEIIPLNP